MNLNRHKQIMRGTPFVAPRWAIHLQSPAWLVAGAPCCISDDPHSIQRFKWQDISSKLERSLSLSLILSHKKYIIWVNFHHRNWNCLRSSTVQQRADAPLVLPKLGQLLGSDLIEAKHPSPACSQKLLPLYSRDFVFRLRIYSSSSAISCRSCTSLSDGPF